MPPGHTRADILQWRREKWAPPLEWRAHTVYDAFVPPYSRQAQGSVAGAPRTPATSVKQVMLRGRVDYGMQDGTRSSASWAGWMVLVPSASSADALKLREYTIWIVSVLWRAIGSFGGAGSYRKLTRRVNLLELDRSDTFTMTQSECPAHHKNAGLQRVLICELSVGIDPVCKFPLCAPSLPLAMQGDERERHQILSVAVIHLCFPD